MASCSTEQWSGNSTPKVTLTVTEQSSNGGQSVLAWTFQYVTNGYTASTSVNKEYSVVVGGETVASGSCSINGKTTFTIASGTKTIAKTHSAQTIAFSCSFGFNLTWSDVYGGTKTASGSISVPAKTTYTISYNANGGSGAPTSQTKWHGEDMTISSTSPTRIGYTFKGWALSQSAANEGTWYYQPSSTCGRNENITLYAVWSVNSYTYNIVYKSSSGTQLGTATASYNYGTTNSISPKSFTGYTSPSAQSVAWDSTSAKTITFTYSPTSYNITIDCNGGSGVSSITYNIETDTFSLGTPTKTGYTFLGWTGSNGTTAQTSVSIAKGSTGNKSYTANWQVNTYTITYKANGGSGDDQTQTVTYGVSWTTKNNKVFTRTGYKLSSWNTKSDGSGTTYSVNTAQTDKQLSNVTLYAQWKISGVVYIDNGTTFEPYLVYIDNGTGWDLYLAYVDNGTSWDIIS